MSFNLSDRARNLMANSLATAANSGSVKLYTGSQPANPQTSPTGTLLASLPLNSTAFRTSVAGTINLNTSPAPVVVPVANGTVGWFRVFDSGGNALFDGSSDDLGLDSTTASTAGEAVINSLSITVPM